MKTLFAVLSSIEALDKWAERVFQSYREWREEQRRIEIDKKAIEASKKGSISALRERVRAEMGTYDDKK